MSDLSKFSNLKALHGSDLAKANGFPAALETVVARYQQLLTHIASNSRTHPSANRLYQWSVADIAAVVSVGTVRAITLDSRLRLSLALAEAGFLLTSTRVSSAPMWSIAFLFDECDAYEARRKLDLNGK